MKGGKLSNIPLSGIREFLQKAGCESKGIKGGHEKWVKEGLSRPIIIQTHIDPVPEFIGDLWLDRKDFLRYILRIYARRVSLQNSSTCRWSVLYKTSQI